MKEKDKKTLLVGAGAVALLGLAVYASRGSGRDEPLNLGGGGGVAGGGIPAVLAGGVDGTGEGTGQAPVTYSVAFPDVSIPTMPVYTPTVDTGGGGSYPSLPADSRTMQPGTYQTGGKKVTTVSPPFIGAPTVSQPAPGAGEGFGGGGAGGRGGSAPAQPGEASGIPGGSSTKKGAAVGQGTAPGGLPGLIGGLIGGIGGIGNAIGGFFGWS